MNYTSMNLLPVNPEETIQIGGKGTYIFFARLNSTQNIQVNKAGRTVRFPEGWYAYVGSAFGSGGLKSRLNRHFSGSGRAHWNIDFFRKSVHPYHKAWVSYQDQKLESIWAISLQRMPGVLIPVANFGNADKRIIQHANVGKSITHLFCFTLRPELNVFQALIDEYLPGGLPIHEIRLPLE